MSGINVKGKIGQFFCRHKNKEWFIRKSQFSSLRGERRLHICTECGKEVGSYFAEYEDTGYK
ncbi:hypothetical protein WKH57_01180 [Niallia taxi]|uniref:hypothetical protein n=1 Tax=Niallia taxi TaxID=2499688 RepID=UPI0031764BEA